MNSTDNSVALNSSLAPNNSSMGKQSSKMSLFSNWSRWKSDPKASVSSSSGGSTKTHTPTASGAPVTSGGALMDLFDGGKLGDTDLRANLNDATTPSPSGATVPMVVGSITTRSEGIILSSESLDSPPIPMSPDETKNSGGTVGKSAGGFFNRFRRKSGSHTTTGSKSGRARVELIKPQKTGPAAYNDYGHFGGNFNGGGGGGLDLYEPNYEPMILACRSVSAVDCLPSASHVADNLLAQSVEGPIESPEPPVEEEIVSEVMERSEPHQPLENGSEEENNNKVSHALADGLNVVLAPGCPTNGLTDAQNSASLDPYGFFRKRSLSGMFSSLV